MTNKLTKMEMAKLIAGVAIVGAAMAIMAPGFLSVFLGLGRIILLIAIAGSACLAVAYGTRYIKRSRQANKVDVDAGSSCANLDQ